MLTNKGTSSLTAFCIFLETTDETTFECLLYKKGTKHHFVSANIIDFNQNDTAYYNTDVDGLIVKDSIPQIPSLLIIFSILGPTPFNLLIGESNKSKCAGFIEYINVYIIFY